VRAVGDDLVVRPQLPLMLVDDSEPEPDLAVVRPGTPSRGNSIPGRRCWSSRSPASLWLSTGGKAVLYARAGIPEYWIVNLAESTVEVRASPTRRAAPIGRRSSPGAATR